MKGFIKGCLITALVCVLIGIVILSVSFSTLGWRGVRELVNEGALTVADWNDWEMLNWRLELEDELSDVRQEFYDAGDEIWELGDEIAAEFRNDIHTTVNDGIEEGMEEILVGLNTDMDKAVEDGMNTIEGGQKEYQEAGGDSISDVLAQKSQIRNLDIDFTGGAFYLLPSTDNQIRIASVGGNVEYSCYRDGDTIIFRDKSGNRVSQYNNRRVFLSLPQDMRFDNLSIDIGGGLMTAQNLQAEVMEITIGAGQVVLNKAAAEDGRFDIGAGEMLVMNSRMQDMGLSIGAGHGVYTGMINGNLGAECSMGSAELLLAGRREDHNYDLGGSAGAILIGDKTYGGLAYGGSADNGADSNFDLSCAMGQISILFTGNEVENDAREESSGSARAEESKSSYFNNFTAETMAHDYAVKGTVHQGKDNNAVVVGLDARKDTTVTVTGSMEPVRGEIRLVYVDAGGRETVIAQGNDDSIDVQLEVGEGRGRIYFDGDTSVCDFDLKFSIESGLNYSLG